MPKTEPLLNREFHTLIHFICESIGIFKHYDPRRIAISVSSSRSKGVYGTLAYVVPLRYIGGKVSRRGKRGGVSGSYAYVNDKLQSEQPEARYLMTFLVPKFFRMKSRDRLETIVHELYHLHPTMRGDLRRFPGTHTHHGPTPAAYNRRVSQLASEALSNAPFLSEHPLLKSSAEQGRGYRTKHYAIPKQRFVPESSPLLSRFREAALVLAFLVVSLSAQALVPVELSTGTMIQSLPRAGSRVIQQGKKGERFKAIKQSPDRRWVFIENSNGSGWVPKERVETFSLARGAKAGQSEPDFSVDKDIEAFDLTQTNATAKKEGQLSSEPSRIAEKYSRVEEGDNLSILGKSQSGDWYHVRLDVTGEEGWVPASLVGLEEFDRVLRSPANSAQLNLVGGTDNLGFGGGVSYYRNLFRRGLGSRLRDRLELGLGVDYHFKNLKVASLSSSDSINLRTFHWTAGMRYLPTASNGRFFGIVELGLSYFYTTVSTTLTQAALDAEGTGRDSTDIAVHLGGGLGVSFSESFYALLQGRLLLKSDIVIIGGLSGGWRF